jgi:glycosyltransferase involved in cell wall biosynthesis
MARVPGRLKKHLVFPTYELHPFNPGGAGVFLSGGVRLLARAGHHVTLLCDFAAGEIEAARRAFSLEPFGDGSVEIVSLAEVDGRPAPQGSIYTFNSSRFAAGLASLNERRAIDFVEFPEYAGLGVSTLRQHQRGFLPDAIVAVRLHGSLEFIDQVEGIVPDAERRMMWGLEREGMELADVLLTPSRALGGLYRRKYGLDRQRFVESPPPMEELLLGFEPRPRLPDPAHFLFFGKLQEVKGCVEFAEATVSLLVREPERGWHATFIGRDTWCGRHGCMTSACLGRVIPGPLRENFSFIPSIDRLDLAKYLRRVVAAVVPSHFETFCLAAHELRSLGLPIIVPRHPAFEDWLTEKTGCLTYDGTANGLANAMAKVRDDAELRLSLDQAPRPQYPAFTEAYARVLGSAEG